jgi:hypothetical protein
MKLPSSILIRLAAGSAVVALSASCGEDDSDLPSSTPDIEETSAVESTPATPAQPPEATAPPSTEIVVDAGAPGESDAGSGETPPEDPCPACGMG